MLGRCAATVAVGFALVLEGCGGDALGSVSTSRFADAANRCAASGVAPTFALASAESGDDSLVISTAPDPTPFEAFVQISRPGLPIVTGGRLVRTDPPPGLDPTRTYFVATVPDLEPGSYSASLQGMLDTNLAPECQKSFAVALGVALIRNP